jgi:hypothetical protein
MLPLITWLFLIGGAFASPFTDADYHRLQQSTLQSHRPVILMTWSPHMVLSQKAVDEMLALKETLNADPVFLLDPNARIDLAQQIVRRHHWPDALLTVNASRELIKKGLRVHYPSYIFVSEGRTVSPIIPGYKVARQLQALRARYLP